MEHTLFHVLLIFNAFCMAMENPIVHTSYRFEVYPVHKCPMNKSEFTEAAIRRNCSRDTRYLCAPDRNLSNLIEFCTNVRRSLYGPDNCVRLEGTGYLNHYKCEEFRSGCPSTPYFDDEIYRYPACLSINRDRNCFVGDRNCKERICNTETETNIKNVIIFVVYVVITIMIGIIGPAFYKGLEGRRKAPIDEKKLKKFLSKGKLTIRHVRCIIVGCGGAGKTTLLRRLQDVQYKDLKNIETTELVDVHANIFEVFENENTIKSVQLKSKLHVPSITFPKNVFEKNDITAQSDESRIKAEQLSNESDESEIEDDEISESESLIDERENMEDSVNKPLNGATEEEVKLVQPLPEEENNFPMLEENKTNIYSTPFSDASEIEFSKIMDAFKDLCNENHLRPRITFLDFAGQSMYYAFQQIYFSPKTCYILVVDMTKRLDDKVYESDVKSCSLFESWRYKDYYKFWLKSIDSYSDTDSPVILVGTHAEALSEQDSDNFFKEFFALFEHHPDIQRHLHMERKFPIRFPENGSKLADLEDIKACIARIVNYRGYAYQIQPMWAIFEQIMQKEKRRRIIPRNFLSNYNDRLGTKFRLNGDNITEMLLFLHRVGNLLYFDENSLKETIILDVQWFVDAFKNIIAYHENIATNDLKSSRFKSTGELSDQELTAIWKSYEGGETYISYKKEILSYMEHFGLLAICDNKLCAYYFPSMNKRKFKNSEEHFTKSSILCFQFNEDKQLPFNIFYRLVVKCLKIPEWSILKEKDQNCWYENVACFSYRHCIVVVCLCKFQIQLQVWIPGENEHIDRKLLCNIHRSAKKILSETNYQIGYKCQKGILNTEEDTSFIAQEMFPVSKLNCPNCALENKHHLDNQICWVQPELSEYTNAVSETNETEQLSETNDNDKEDYREKQEQSPHSPLRIACENGQESTVQNLLDMGAEVNKLDQDGFGPLSISCYKGYNTFVRCLLDRGADINLRNNIGSSPLYIACENGHQDTVRLLLTDHANINLCKNNGTSPLYVACKYGHTDIALLLLNTDAEINTCRNSGSSPLFIACQNKHTNTVQLLLSKGADVNLCRKSGLSPLHIACRYGYKDIVQLLLNTNANINVRRINGASPLYYACQYGHKDTVQLLLNNGANINLCTKNGASPLHIACKYGHEAIVQLLLNKKYTADINLCNNRGASPLSIACQFGHDSIVQRLLNNNAGINLYKNNGTGPLHIACQYGYDSIAQILVNVGADINVRTSEGLTPLDIANVNKHTQIVDLLLNKMRECKPTLM